MEPRPIVFKEWREGMESYDQCGQGWSYCSLCSLDTIHKLFFATRLIINPLLVYLHSLKTMGLGSIIFKEWRVTWTFSYTLMGCVELGK
jgi:hypothetical protein